MDTILSFSAAGRLIAEAVQSYVAGKLTGTLTLRDSGGGEPIRIMMPDAPYTEQVAALINAAGASDLNLSEVGKEAIRKRWPNIADDMIAMGFGHGDGGDLMPLDARDLVEMKVTRCAGNPDDRVQPAGDGWTVVRSILKGTHPVAADGDKLLWVRSKPIGRRVPRPVLVKTEGAMGVSVPVSRAAE